MPLSNLKAEEAKEATWEAGRGAVIGSLKWGAVAAVIAGVGQTAYPLYRGLTIQFKVYIQMSAMIMGGMLEADNRMRMYEQRIRLQNRRLREQAKWERYEQEFLEQKSEK